MPLHHTEVRDGDLVVYQDSVCRVISAYDDNSVVLEDVDGYRCTPFLDECDWVTPPKLKPKGYVKWIRSIENAS
jgi:hypothetical protein